MDRFTYNDIDYEIVPDGVNFVVQRVDGQPIQNKRRLLTDFLNSLEYQIVDNQSFKNHKYLARIIHGLNIVSDGNGGYRIIY